MKTEYEKLYEFITPMIVSGKLTPSEAAKILATVQLLEMRVNALEKAYHNVFSQEHAEHNDYSNIAEGEE